MSVFGKSHFVSNGIHGSNVLSVKTDQRNRKDVIITCNNCIRVYELSERTILDSWTFKSWMAPVSGCVTSSKGEFYCPVASNALLSWTSDQKQLENLPQIKFGSSLSSLESVSGAVYVVFEGGCVEEISQAIFHRKVKRPQLLPPSFTVQQLQLGDSWVTVVATSMKDESRKTSIFQYPLGCTDPAQVLEFKLERRLLSLTGACLLNYCRVITLWSNGELCVSAVCQAEGGALALTARTLGRLEDLVDCARPARLLPLCDWVVAVLGLDISKDGGRIVLWDLENHVQVAKRNFKLYQPSLRCWAGGLGGSGGAILLHEKQELTVVPLNTMPPRGIAPYVLNQPPISVSRAGELPVKTWPQPNPIKEEAPSLPAPAWNVSLTPNIDALVRECDLQTLDLSLSVATLVNKATERRSVALACEIMSCFKGSLPERSIVDLIALLFAADYSDLAAAVLNHVDLGCYGPASAPPSLKDFFEHLEKNSGKLRSDFSTDSPVRQAPGKRKRDKSSSPEKKFKRARMEGALNNGHGELTNGQLPNGHAEPANEEASLKDDTCPMFKGGWLLLHQLLCAPFTRRFLTKELKRLPFRNALSLVDYLARLRGFSPVLDFTAAQNHTHQTADSDSLSAVSSNSVLQKSPVLDAKPVKAELQVVVPTTDIVVLWHAILYEAHESSILLEMELQNAACLSDDELLNEELDACDQLETAHAEQLLAEEAEQEGDAAATVKADLPDPLYSTELITFPW